MSLIRTSKRLCNARSSGAVSTQSDEGFRSHAATHRAALSPLAMPQPDHLCWQALSQALTAHRACASQERRQRRAASARTQSRQSVFRTQARQASDAGAAQASRSSGAGSRTKAGRCSSHRGAVLLRCRLHACAHDGVARMLCVSTCACSQNEGMCDLQKNYAVLGYCQCELFVHSGGVRELHPVLGGV